ncbi:hypothetical protein GW17_00055571 [Ensete ventricosum]|nr:hypothetical protein GW17_00055571 [Ensete ventricosum]
MASLIHYALSATFPPKRVGPCIKPMPEPHPGGGRRGAQSYIPPWRWLMLLPPHHGMLNMEKQRDQKNRQESCNRRRARESSFLSKMESLHQEHVIGIPVSSVAYAGAEELPGNPDPSHCKQSNLHLSLSLSIDPEPSPSLVSVLRLGCVIYVVLSLIAEKDSVVDWMSKLGEKAGGFREHGNHHPSTS